MTQKIDLKDLKLAYLLAEYRLLTVKQISVLEAAPIRTAHRRMAKLFCQDYLLEMKRPIRGRPGRPEFIYSLSPKGVQWLQENGMLEEGISYEKNRVEKSGEYRTSTERELDSDRRANPATKISVFHRISLSNISVFATDTKR